MLLARRRRRRSAYSAKSEYGSGLFVRLAVGLVLIGGLWYGASAILGVFGSSSQERTAVRLNIDGRSDGVQVSLQGGESVRAEDGLRMYENDGIYTRMGGSAILTFFDGTAVRMDEETEVLIRKSERLAEGTSRIHISVPQGRIWVRAPSLQAYSGSIVRTVSLETMDVDIPAKTTGLLSSNVVFLADVAGMGATVTLTAQGAQGRTIVIGEGQMFQWNETVRRDIVAGADPYEFRRPASSSLLSDLFVRESNSRLAAMFAQSSLPDGMEEPSSDILTVTRPQQDESINGDTVLVSGRVGSVAVQSVSVNGHSVSLDGDNAFSRELSLTGEESMTIVIEARDESGLVLAEARRTVTREQRTVPSPTISAPGQSGATVTVRDTEIEIRGGAPANTAGIMVNDYRLQLFRQGDRSWSYLASTRLGNFRPGENVFEIFALDAAGNKSAPARLTVILDVPAPTGTTDGAGGGEPTDTDDTSAPLAPGTLSVTSPAAGTRHTTNETELLLEGNTSPETASVWVNGYRLQLYEPGKNFWNYIASTNLNTLRRGENRYSIVARNAQGQVLDRIEYVITLEVR